MAALRSVRSRQQVSSFCMVGQELLSGPVCLSGSRWETALDSIEKARVDPFILPPLASLSTKCAVEAVRHYHSLYTRCARLVVMPRCRWQRWREGLRAFMGVQAVDGTYPLNEVCSELLTSHEAQFAIVFWGCYSSLRVRLEFLIMRIGATTASDTALSPNGVNGHCMEDTPAEEANGDDVDISILRLRNRCFSELYQFQRLAHDASHLFGYYAAIGRAERQWLSDTFMTEQQNEEAAEALIRRSFKRDFGVPCAELESGVLLEEYKSFEVNERKEKALLKKMQGTLKSPWNTKARDLQAYELLQQERHLHQQRQQQQQQEEVDGNGTLVQESVYDERGFVLLDELVKCLRSEAGKSLMAFAVTMQRVLEKESFPAFMDLTRLDVALKLLQQWFDVYAYERHHGDIPLFLDADLWSFLLERHTELLKWVVFHYCGSGARMNVPGAIEGVKAVSFSLLRCLEVYCAAIATRRSLEDVKMHLEDQARRRVSEWAQCTVANTFLVGIQHTCADSELPSSSSSSFPSLTFLTARIALDKAQLLLMCDASLFVMDARQILCPILELGLREMSTLCGDADAYALTRWTMCMIGLLNTLCRTLQHATDGPGAGDDLVYEINDHYRFLQRLSPANMVELVHDARLNFLSDKGRHVLGSRRAVWLDIGSPQHAAQELPAQQQQQERDEDESKSDLERKRARKEE